MSSPEAKASGLLFFWSDTYWPINWGEIVGWNDKNRPYVQEPLNLSEIPPCNTQTILHSCRYGV